jgi:CDP-6-deoxy-D-xylo-4-hexulose-3-dehydrase
LANTVTEATCFAAEKQMIRFGVLDFGTKERLAIQKIIEPDEPQLTMGRLVFEFERKFATWLGSKYAVMVNSGTSALITAISAYSQVYSKPEHLATTALTYPATWNAIRACGINLSIKDIEDDFTVHSTNSVNHLGVHTFGKPCTANMIIEDACEALGSFYKSRHLGTFAKLGCFSFYVAHQVNTIEGGMVVTDNAELYEACRSIRDNGRICTCPICTLKTSGKCSKRIDAETDRRWQTKFFGYNFKPTEFHGALGLAKMETINENIRRRNEILKIYSHHFGTLMQEEDEFIAPMMYPVKVENPQQAICQLEKKGIETRGMLPAYSEEYCNASRISKTHILIPLHHKLSDSEVQYIVEEVKKLCTR